MTTTKAATVAALNDEYRAQLGGLRSIKGRTVMTRRVASLDPAKLLRVMMAVSTFHDFTASNDPYGEHDLGIVELEGDRYMWKFDYYENDELKFGAENPADGCYRVLTIMFAEEY